MAADYRIEEAAVDRFAFAVELDPSGFGQAVFVWIQAADAVGQRFGQHRDRPVGKVDAGGAGVGLLVQCRVRANVMGDVGDGDEKLVAAALARVRRRASSKSRAFSPSMVTMGNSRRSARPAISAGLISKAALIHFAVHVGRKTRRQPEAEDDRLRLDLGIVGSPITCTRVASGATWRCRSEISAAMTLPSVSFVPAAQAEWRRCARPSGSNSPAVDFLVGADQPFLAAFDDLHDMGFAAAARLRSMRAMT